MVSLTIQLSCESRVNFLVDAPFPTGFHQKRDNGKTYWIMLKYEKLSDICYTCGIMGHISKSCSVKDQLSLDTPSSSAGKYGPWLRATAIPRHSLPKFNLPEPMTFECSNSLKTSSPVNIELFLCPQTLPPPPVPTTISLTKKPMIYLLPPIPPLLVPSNSFFTHVLLEPNTVSTKLTFLILLFDQSLPINLKPFFLGKISSSPLSKSLPFRNLSFCINKCPLWVLMSILSSFFRNGCFLPIWYKKEHLLLCMSLYRLPQTLMQRLKMIKPPCNYRKLRSWVQSNPPDIANQSSRPLL